MHRDVPPFMKFSGDPNSVRGVNEEGLRRNNFSEEEVEQLKLAYRTLYRSYTISASLEELEQQERLNGHVRYLCEFIRRSMESRFGRYQETLRRDKPQDRRRDIPVEVKTKNRRKEERK
ncbi:MAG: Acyl-(acyl-carrier-protein)--UDP-N-acetylglucosamine O-acyltransferase [Planctomycetes bacterium ADurb.Bin412]|nr:MAG: Acyl-(acyl-carrier-protein)--UDP-N-acetylglucosamine O-acyltransferase [Planctomycetes bacterium ADurb.Bin412]